MGYFTLFEGMLIGLFFFSALFSLFLALKNIELKINLSYFFFAICLGLGISFSSLGLGTDQVSKFFLYDKLNTTFLSLAGIAYLYLISCITRYKFFLGKYLLILLLLLFLIINSFSQTGAAWQNVVAMIPTKLVWGEIIYLPDGEVSHWLLFAIVILVFLLIYSIRALVYQINNGEKRKAYFLLIALFIGFIGLIIDQALIFFGGLQLVVIDEIGYLGFIIMVGYLNFNTVLKSATMKKELEYSELKFRTLFQNADDGILLMEKGKFIDCNNKALVLFDYTKNELIGKSLKEVSPKYQANGELSSKYAITKINEVILNNPMSFEWVHIRKDGTLFNAEVSLHRLLIENREILQVRVRDITFNKQIENQFKESEYKLRNLIEGMNDCVMQVDNEDRIAFVNNKFTELLGFTLEEIKGKVGFEVLLDPCDYHIIKKMNALRTQNISNQYEIAFKSKSGKKIDFLVSGSPVYNSDGEVIGSFGVMTDITQRKLSEEKIKLSEEKFRSFIEQSSNGFVLTDKNGIIIDFNKAQEKLTGISRNDALGKSIWDLQLSLVDTSVFPIEEARSKLDRVKKIVTDPKRGIGFIEKIKQTEIRIRNRNGNILVILLTIFPVVTETDFFIGSIYVDITERKTAEDAIRNIIDSSPFGAHSYSLEENNKLIFTDYNKSAVQILGQDHSSFVNKSIEELFPHLVKTELSTIYRNIAKGELKNYEGIIRYQDGPVRGIFELFAFNTGENKMSVFFIDTTEKRKVEESIITERKNFLRLFEDSPIPMQIVEKQSPHKRLIVNKAYEELVGANNDEILSSSVLNNIEDKIISIEVYEELRNIFEIEGEVENYPIVFMHNKLGQRNFLLTVRSIIFNNEECILNVLQDVTEIEHAKNELQVAFNYIQFIMDSIQSIIISVDINLYVTHYNNASLNFIDEQSDDAYIFNKFPKLKFIESTLVETIQYHSGNDTITKTIVNHTGETQNYLLSISKIKNTQKPGFVILLEDITERKKIDELMIQSEKMLSVAGLAAGMAHEINNPLGTIVQGCQNILRRTSDVLPKNNEIAQRLGITITTIEAYMRERQIHDIIESMRTAAGKASEIIKNMLQFSRRSESKKIRYNIIQLVDDTLELVYNDYDMKKKFDFRNIKIIKEFPSSLPEIKITVTEIEQVIFNIVRNAAQAIYEENNKAKIPQIVFRLRLELDFIVLEIEDNGPGIPDIIRSRIFEPFFTTKEVGDGTGLGLSVSYMIIKNNHDGILTFTSKEGKGTTFIIKLPL